MLHQLKKISFTGLALLVSFGAQAWKGRVVPMSYDTRSGEWNVLLHLDSEGHWSDFWAEGRRGERGDSVAQRALEYGTKSTYTVGNASLTGVPWKETTGHDFVHFVPVRYVSGRDLYQTASAVGNDFVWVPVSSILASTGDVQLGRRSETVNRGVLAMLRAYLPTAISQLTTPAAASSATPSAAAAAAGPAVSAAAPSGHVNWLTIPGAILFYDKGKPYYEFTNFQEGYPLNIDGKIWPTSEHYFQAQKFVGNSALQERIRTAPSARAAFDLARANSASVRSDWDTARFDAMMKALRAKFEQHPALRRMLLSTGTKKLVENAGANDKFWGAGDGSGNNLLGQMLEHVREELSTGARSSFLPLYPVQ